MFKLLMKKSTFWKISNNIQLRMKKNIILLLLLIFIFEELKENSKANNNINGSEFSIDKEIMSIKKKKYKKEKNDISLCMVGDLLIHKNLSNFAYNNKTKTYNYDFIFEYIEKYIKEYDMRIANDEVLIAGKNFGVRGYPRFNTPFELADSIVKAGFNIILKATNHVNDLGQKALISDLNNWKNKYPNITVTGSYLSESEYNKISYYTKNGIKIALLNYCYKSNVRLANNYTMNKNRFFKIKNDIQKAKNEGAEFIIVFPHWGTEYSLHENERQKIKAIFYFSLGVDLVIGTHPHVIQPVKYIKDDKTNRIMYIFYSIGNFINATSKRGKDIFLRFLGGMAHVIIGRNKNNKVIVKDIKFIPLITHIFEKYKKTSTFKVRDYNKSMAKQNFVGIEYDNTYSYENMIQTFKNVVHPYFLDFDY